MTESKLDEVKDDRKLKGKTNFVSWKREFERAAKANDIFEYLTGEEIVPSKPRKEDYFEKLVEVETRRLTRSRTTAQTATPSTEGDEEMYDAQTMAPANNTLRWQIDYSEYKTAKEKMKFAGKLLDAWVSDGIKIEIEDCTDAKEAYDFIMKRYAVTNERARDSLLHQLNGLKLEDCPSMTEYTNKVRQIKADLKTVKYDMTDDMLATALLHGLPPNFQDFKEKYDWIRSTNPEDPPDLDYLYERLHVEETKQIRLKEEKKARDRARKEAINSNNPHGSTGYNGSRRPKREDRRHLKCTYPGCGRTGHSEDTCWTKDPSKAPRSFKDKIATNTDDKSIDVIGGTTETNPTTFRDAYSRANDLGTAPSSAPYANTADTSPQMRSVEGRRKVPDSGGAGTGNLKLRGPSLAKRTLGAFLVGTSCTPDTWLADTGANMHIVNNIKWFKKETFRPFNDCSIDISTADGSTTLKVKGGGTVQIVLKNPDGSPKTVSLSEVAYAPQGKCNLFSGGMFAQKAKLTGIYNDQYMTWINDQGHEIGCATFENGLYHLDAEKVPTPFESGEVVAATVDFDDPVWKWHRRLGHLGFQNMLKLLDSSTGMNVTAAQIKAKLKAICPVCAVTRALVKIPRDPAKRHAQEPGQMVHVDVWGPYPIEGFDGTKYFLFITDDCTRYTWSARFDRKYQLLEVFESLVKFIQKAYNITIRCCRLDNEFERGPVGKWCDSHSIAREAIEPYAHYQNGVAERTNRTIRERAAPMVQETSISGQVSKIVSEKGTELLRISSIPENLWPEAIQHAVWLKNRTPARALRKKEAKTPYEALKGAKPTLTRERIWGSRAYVTYPLEFRTSAEMTKLHSPRGWLGYFVGCESEAIYHIYSPEKHKVYRIGVARVEDGEGLDDPQDTPCLEDRIPTRNVEIADRLSSENEDETTDDDDKDHDDDRDREFPPLTENAEPPSRVDTNTADTINQLQSEEEDADGEEESDPEITGPETTSKYFDQSRHVGMAKRKIVDDVMVAPTKSRSATHDSSADKQNSSLSDIPDQNDDSWYHSDNGKVSRIYWEFVAKHGRTDTKTYLPDNDKCDFCFRKGRTCDSAENGIPCTICKNEKRRCIPQTEKTKRLVLPENRYKRREIGGSQQDPPCRLCFQTNKRCVLVGPVGSPCEGCKNSKLRCNWNLEKAKRSTIKKTRQEAEKQARYDRLGFVPVSRDRKCYRCAQRRIACDGRLPCNRCSISRLRRSCRLQGVEGLPACNRCRQARGKECDRGRPCKTCIDRKQPCIYESQDGLVSRAYLASDVSPPGGFSSVGRLAEGEPSDEECARCTRLKLHCDGEQPCHRCVKSQEVHKTAACRYRRSNGAYESWLVRPFQITSSGETTLRENYEAFTGLKTKSKVSKELRTLRDSFKPNPPVAEDDDQSEAKDNDNDDIDSDELNAQHQAAKSSLQRFKFGLSAYSERRLSPPVLKLNCTPEGKYHESKKEELQSHAEKGTWVIVPVPEGVKPLTSRWVNTDKYGPDGEVIKQKSRLVARGFQQEEGIDYEETFASVVKPASTRILLALAAVLFWQVHQGDVKTAFLNSNLDKPVYMRPPKDIKLPPGFCLMLIRALYGLKQSPRAWYQKLRNTLINWGWRMSAYDPCVFINDGTGLILEVHVDDINVMGKDIQAILDFKTQISQTFPMTDEGECSWYLGMHVEQKPGEIRIHQKQYIDQIVAKYGFTQAVSARTPLDKDIKLTKQDGYVAHPKFRTHYQSKVGSLNFASNQTRPDIAFATGYVARYASNPNQIHMDSVDRIFTYLKNDPGKGIVYSGKHGLQLRGFVDSDFAGCEDSRRSTTGWVFTLAGGPVSWSSQRQKTVATSTMDAEYIAGSEATKEAVWIRNFINDLRIPGVHIDTVPLYIDNNSALKLTRNPEFHNRSKHIDVKHHFIREKVDEGVINTQRIDTKDNLADVFTKALPRPTHEGLVNRLSLLSGEK